MKLRFRTSSVYCFFEAQHLVDEKKNASPKSEDVLWIPNVQKTYGQLLAKDTLSDFLPH